MTHEFEFLRELISNINREHIRKTIAKKFRSLHLALADDETFLRECVRRVKSKEGRILLKLIFLGQKINPIRLERYLEKLVDIMYMYHTVKSRISKMKKSLKTKMLILSSVSSLLVAVFLNILGNLSYSMFILNKNFLVIYTCLTFMVMILINVTITAALFKESKIIITTSLIPMIGVLVYFLLILFFS